jgi:hypothetical protein
MNPPDIQRDMVAYCLARFFKKGPIKKEAYCSEPVNQLSDTRKICNNTTGKEREIVAGI